MFVVMAALTGTMMVTAGVFLTTVSVRDQGPAPVDGLSCQLTEPDGAAVKLQGEDCEDLFLKHGQTRDGGPQAR